MTKASPQLGFFFSKIKPVPVPPLVSIRTIPFRTFSTIDPKAPEGVGVDVGTTVGIDVGGIWLEVGAGVAVDLADCVGNGVGVGVAIGKGVPVGNAAIAA